MNILKKRKGFSLTEVLMVMVVAAMVLITGFSIYNSQMNDARAKQVVQQVNMIINSAKTIYASNASYSGASMSVLSDSQALPVELQGQSNYYNPWSGTYTLTSTNSTSGTADILSLTTTFVPQAVCPRIVGALAPSLYMVYVNGTASALMPAADANGWNRYDVNYGQVTNLCKNKTNTIVFQFLKPFDANAYLNPTLNTLTPTQSAYVDGERTRIKSAMQKRETIQTGL